MLRDGASADEILRRLDASSLRGRGGGWFPVGRKWHAVRVEGGEPLVVANGAEGEPGSLKDRWLMRTRPRDVVAGAALAARTLGAAEALVYLKGAFGAEEAALQGAIAEGAAAGTPVRVLRGADTYVAGEETAVLEVIEGRRPWPRPKPPLPAGVGLFGRPTLVQNVETLARVPAAVADPDAFRSSETTLATLWGHVPRPGVREVRLGTPVADILTQAGVDLGAVGMVLPAGPSAPPLLPGSLETPLHPDALRAAGSGLGTAALLVVDRDACPLSVAASAARFFARESCGQCPPCTAGTRNLERILEGLEGGTARARDLTDLVEAAGFMSMHGYCAHTRTSAAVITGMVRLFPSEVQEHVRAGGCPGRGRQVDPFADGSPERTAVEAALPSL